MIKQRPSIEFCYCLDNKTLNVNSAWYFIAVCHMFITHFEIAISKILQAFTLPLRYINSWRSLYIYFIALIGILLFMFSFLFYWQVTTFFLSVSFPLWRFYSLSVWLRYLSCFCHWFFHYRKLNVSKVQSRQFKREKIKNGHTIMHKYLLHEMQCLEGKKTASRLIMKV